METTDRVYHSEAILVLGSLLRRLNMPTDAASTDTDGLASWRIVAADEYRVFTLSFNPSNPRVLAKLAFSYTDGSPCHTTPIKAPLDALVAALNSLL